MPVLPVLDIPAIPARRAVLRRWGLEFEVGLSLAAGIALILILPASPEAGLAALSVLTIWLVSAFHSGRAVASPFSRPFRTALQNLMPPLAFAAAGVGFVGLTPSVITTAVPVVVAAGVVSAGIRWVRWRLQGPVRVVLAGDRTGISQGLGHLWTASGTRVVGAVLVGHGDQLGQVDSAVFGVPVSVGVESVADFATGIGCDAVIVSPGPHLSALDLKRLEQRLEATPVAVGVLGILDSVAAHRIRPGGVGKSTILDIRSPRPSAWVRLVKAATDRVVAAVALVLLAPLMLLLCAVVKMTSPGPVFFVQRRAGRAGKSFNLIKLRTMVDGADVLKEELRELEHHNDVAESVLFKLKEDPRVTRVGRFLRRYSLDELPQFWNVFKGDMSLVGPRPYLQEEIARMDPDTLRRLAVRPGLTGLWQVSGRSDLDWDESVRLDTYYADNWSLGGDLRIIAQTLPAVAKARGAY